MRLKRVLILTTVLPLIVCLMAGCGGATPTPSKGQTPSTDAQGTGIETAKQVVREFLGNPSANVDYVGDFQTYTVSTYQLTCEGVEYLINKANGNIEGITYPPSALVGDTQGMTTEQIEQLASKINVREEEARTAAEALAVRLYPDFAILSLSKSETLGARPNPLRYHFEWRQMIGSVPTDNAVSIDVSPYTGNILHYIGFYVADLASFDSPSVSSDEARELARSVQVTGTVSNVSEPELRIVVDNGRKRCVWEATAQVDTGLATETCIVWVDAYSGEAKVRGWYR